MSRLGRCTCLKLSRSVDFLLDVLLGFEVDGREGRLGA